MIQNKEIHNSTRGRRLAKILEYIGMEILYKPGKTNIVVDTLSRIPTLENHQSEEWIE
jgi:hypothetical protein